MRKSKRSVATVAIVGEIVPFEADDTTCSVCYAEFLDHEDLKVHIQQVHPPGKLVNCQFCEKILPNAEIYAVHVRDVHLTDLRSCPYCYRIFTDTSMFRKHQLKHTRSMPKNTFSCSQCNLLSSSILELSQHEFSEHPFGDGVFLNRYYSLLSSVLNIKADNVIQAIGKDFIYVCSQCKHSDADLEGYISHLKINNCRSLVCDRCYRVFGKKRAVIEHLTKKSECINMQKVPLKTQCKDCKKIFDRKTFTQHVKACKAIKCSNCKKVFDTMYELSEHQSKEHPLAVVLVVCTFCRKECVGKIALDKHIDRVHSHELHLYKYTCSYCQTTFKHPQRLFAHYFVKHKEIEPYNCNICNKKFRIRKQFTLHIKLVHSSNGFVEFDEKLHVFFTDKKSDKPFQPVSKYTVEKASENNKSNELDKSTENDNEDLQLVNVNSDFMNPTETEGNQTDANPNTVQRKRKRRTKSSYKNNEIDEMVKLTDDGDSEDEPLVVIKKKAKIKSQLRKRDLNWNKKPTKPASMKDRFTCKICKQYCYTFQNYHNHVSMHFKDESKRCVKCSLSFKSKADLQRHLVNEHSSSKLTETLKNLLERRKKGEQKEEISITNKFLNTIKKVQCDKDDVTATLTPITKELSVQKFIENFTPEVNENKGIQIKENITFNKVLAPKRKPLIKMTKFKPAPVINEANIKLAMPVRFKKNNEKHSVTIKKLEGKEFESKLKLHYEVDDGQFQDDYDHENDYCIQENNRDAYIPEAEQEVTLEGTDEAPKRKSATHKIVIPKLPKELKSLRIAHLLPEAPYYKIVKMDDIIPTSAKKVKEAPIVKKNTPVRLPDGTKLVHVNPLAHLLGNTPVEKLIQPNSKYYKPKNRNFEDALAKALQKLENPKKHVRKKAEKAQAQLEEARKQESENDEKAQESVSGELPELDESSNQIEIAGNEPADTEA